MLNSLAGLAVNLGGNLLFVERYGITAAGAVWGATILVVQILTAWQSNRSVGVRTFGRPALLAAVSSLATVGLVGVVARTALGETMGPLLLAAGVGGVLHLVVLSRLRSELHLDTWWSGLRRR